MNEDTEMTDTGMTSLDRRAFLAGSAGLLAAAALWPAHLRAAAQNRNFAAALGWTVGDSGRHLQDGFNTAVADLGGRLTTTDAGYDPRVQSDQIDSLAASKPDALFITPGDAVAIKPAVDRAINAGIPVFCADSMVPGSLVVTTSMSNNFGMGQYSCEYICKALGGKGRIARVILPTNESWDQRTLGMEWTLRQYPGIKIVAEWAFALTGNITPRQAVDNILTSSPDVDAIWCAWDGPAAEGTLAARAAGRNDLILTGIDGGSQAFSYIAADTQLKLSMAQTFYTMAYSSVFYAHEKLADRAAPRLVVTPTYAVVRDMLREGIPDDYDIPGRGEELGWSRVL